MVADEPPAWAARLRAERRERCWSQKEMARRLREAADPRTRAHLASPESLIRMIRGWERGDHLLRDPYRVLYSRVFATSETDLFGGDPSREATPIQAEQPSPAIERLETLSRGQVAELLEHLRDQWHLLVKRDNLLGPRHTLTAVREQIALLEALLGSAREGSRLDVLRLAAQYAESAAWLHEDAGDLPQARYWTDRAMAWAHESDDQLMLAWTMFRRSQQATAERAVGEVIGLANAARRKADVLPAPMRAAILQQEAQGHALDRDERRCHALLDEAQMWAASVRDDGDARGGHGSFCSTAYVEIQRARCWLMLDQSSRSLSAYEAALPVLSPVYRRDRAMALAGMAAAYAAEREPVQAATVAGEALEIALGAGSSRILNMIKSVGSSLDAHETLPAVAALRTALAGVPAV
ncbi:hypothetical protein AB0O34_04055 [Sphaerisporangium sp. NPDC088356]|uniref:hypothetical protein n=1 Tax=Sphaerisporangium sp. NPDC088356 TaxID=3154871 RepID=UPI00342C85E7